MMNVLMVARSHLMDIHVILGFVKVISKHVLRQTISIEILVLLVMRVIAYPLVAAGSYTMVQLITIHLGAIIRRNKL